MVYTSGAVSIEHEGVARVFYSKQKPRVCTINHKPQLSCTMQSRRALFGHGLCTWLSDCGVALLHKVAGASVGEDALTVAVASYSA